MFVSAAGKTMKGVTEAGRQKLKSVQSCLSRRESSAPKTRKEFLLMAHQSTMWRGSLWLISNDACQQRTKVKNPHIVWGIF
jgi:hypothetical protein